VSGAGRAWVRIADMIRDVSGRVAVIALFLLAPTVMAESRSADPTQAAAEHLQIESVRVGNGRHWMLYLDGYIEPGADRRLARFVDQQGIAQADVYFNSPGGSLLAGMSIGRFLRARGFDTHVGARSPDAERPADGICYSACPFAYAGGVQRTLRQGSVLGVHRARNRAPVTDEEAFERRVQLDASRYLVEMSVNPAMVGFMQAVPPGGIRVLTRDEALGFRLVNAGIAGGR